MEFYYDSVDNGVLILSADGGLMSDNASRFVGELERYVELGVRKLIVDCTRLTRVSSYGLGILISLHKRLARVGGDVKLAAVSGIVAKIIHVTALGSRFHIYPTVEAARLAFADAAADSRSPGGGESKHPHFDPARGPKREP